MEVNQNTDSPSSVFSYVHDVIDEERHLYLIADEKIKFVSIVRTDKKGRIISVVRDALAGVPENLKIYYIIKGGYTLYKLFEMDWVMPPNGTITFQIPPSTFFDVFKRLKKRDVVIGRWKNWDYLSILFWAYENNGKVEIKNIELK